MIQGNSAPRWTMSSNGGQNITAKVARSLCVLNRLGR